MAMFCHQCQETALNKGCAGSRGVCGKSSEVANLQDLFIWTLKGVAWWAERAREAGVRDDRAARFVTEGLFNTITNANFSAGRFVSAIREALAVRDNLRTAVSAAGRQDLADPPACATWQPADDAEIAARAEAGTGGWLEIADEDIRSLKALALYGLKGIAAYLDHAARIKENGREVFDFLTHALAVLADDGADRDKLLALVLKTGGMGVTVMRFLDQANAHYGDSEISRVKTGVRDNPGILITGHDLLDLEQLLEQAAGTGVDVYTHGEMLPAHYRPFFKKYPHLAGNYGNSWYLQKDEIARFNGPVLFTSNCLVPPDPGYLDRVFTTGAVGFDGARHIPEAQKGAPKDFSPVIERAKKCAPPQALENGEIVGGFGHRQLLALADKVIAAVMAGKIKRFVVMAGCDGRHKSRAYYTEVAEKLPADTVILTAGCAKYRYLKLGLGDIDGIPRVLDAGQCNDSYSLAVIALELQKAFGLSDINQLPVSYDIAWYEQKAVLVLLALLHLGVKGIRLGPTLPGFLSPGVADLLVKTFDLKPIAAPEDDIAAMMAGN